MYLCSLFDYSVIACFFLNIISIKIKKKRLNKKRGLSRKLFVLRDREILRELTRKRYDIQYIYIYIYFILLILSSTVNRLTKATIFIYSKTKKEDRPHFFDTSTLFQICKYSFLFCVFRVFLFIEYIIIEYHT